MQKYPLLAALDADNIPCTKGSEILLQNFTVTVTQKNPMVTRNPPTLSTYQAAPVKFNLSFFAGYPSIHEPLQDSAQECVDWFHCLLFTWGKGVGGSRKISNFSPAVIPIKEPGFHHVFLLSIKGCFGKYCSLERSYFK